MVQFYSSKKIVSSTGRSILGLPKRHSRGKDRHHPPILLIMPSSTPSQHLPSQVGDDELKQVMADFLAQGYADTILSLCRQQPECLTWTGELLADERFAVRLGVSVLFECLVEEQRPDLLALAIPGLHAQLSSPVAWIRGEAAGVLGIIATEEALAPLRALLNDPVPQVAEMVRDILQA